MGMLISRGGGPVSSPPSRRRLPPFCPARDARPAPHPCRPSDSKKKKAALKKGGSKSSLKASNSAANLNGDATGLEAALQDFQLNDRSTTGVLTSHPQSRDVHFESFSLLFHGHVLLQDTVLELNYGRWVRAAQRAAVRQGAAPSGERRGARLACRTALPHGSSL